MLPETYAAILTTLSRLKQTTADLALISAGPDHSRPLNIALTHTQTALLWVQEDMAERSAPASATQGAG